MTIKFSDTSTATPTMITVRCDLCTKIVYSTTKDIQNNHQKHPPYICETYKVYCERCYMTPLLKIKELVTMLEQYEIKEEKKNTRRSKRVEKEKNKFDELLNEFY